MTTIEIFRTANLKEKQRYFSRSANVEFTVIRKKDTEIQFGIAGSAQTKSFKFFEKIYLSQGAVEN